ncbi:hypothetical protein [Methylomagnum ishizawai]|uniref:hypothetical protein n=1 Tax=Methylomagnum ishizawai TaxID=1760988 RepID=UPI001C32F2F6|nr:hypothetical protein [Methylomagnum ishizawai]BBL73694.1 hypothetical protein MishRS11D_07920 [Methylomagnum ishizawai]
MSTAKYDNNPNLGIVELQPESNEGDGVKNEEKEKINVKNNPFLRQQAISLMTSKMTESDQVKLQRIRKKIKNIRRSLFRSERGGLGNLNSRLSG